MSSATETLRAGLQKQLSVAVLCPTFFETRIADNVTIGAFVTSAQRQGWSTDEIATAKTMLAKEIDET